MKRSAPKNIVASVNARLVQRSHELKVEHQLTLARFGGERLLYRLSKSAFANLFIFKGAALLLLWLGDAIRPTKDIDLLGFGDTSADALKSIFAALCAVDSPDDGLAFVADTVKVEPIREGQEYGGMRVTLMAMLGNVRIPLQVDVGTGDAVVPPPETVDFPGLLDLPRARLRVYRPETAIAEKTEAMVTLALANSRMKDFFDVHRLAMTRSFDGDVLRAALAATFDRRQVARSSEVPLALTAEFGSDSHKQTQWTAFMRRVPGTDRPGLSEVVEQLRGFLWPAPFKRQRGTRPGRGPGLQVVPGATEQRLWRRLRATPTAAAWDIQARWRFERELLAPPAVGSNDDFVAEGAKNMTSDA